MTRSLGNIRCAEVLTRLAMGVLYLVSLVHSAGAKGNDSFTVEQLDFFESRIRPVLIEHCQECHSANEKQKGGLNLTFRNGLLRGGDSGPSLVPGSPDESLLIEALRYESLEMPPTGKLPDRVVNDFFKWIAMGAADPRKEMSDVKLEQDAALAPTEASALWSLQPLVDAAPPVLEGVKHPIDRFVQTRLAEQGIPVATSAEDWLLLRRLYLELTGLPPTPDQHATFVRAVSKDHDAAVEAVVDQLLASAPFGQRWARHWLDLTSYADTIGIGRSIPALEAWRYRDYVIDAFNDDKPFDQFIKQQIAGDIQIPAAPGVPRGPEPTAESIIATGFLAIGPWELVGGDKAQLRMDVVDRQVNRVGKAFLGITLECARCHSHKFDPISQEDYFALAGIFKSTVTLNGRINGVFSRINQTALPETPEELFARAERAKAFRDELGEATRMRDEANRKVADLKRQVSELEKEIEEIDAAERTGPQEKMTELKSQLSAAQGKAKGFASRIGVLNYLKAHRTQSLALAVTDTPEPEDSPINIRGNAHQLGPVVPRGFPKEITPKEKPAFTRGGSGRVQLAEWIASRHNPLTARVWVNRVWHHLFGVGLVRTVDNFGSRGELPSHPPLLDYLAKRFMDDGWSTKKLIRHIVLSRTWQQSATNSAALAAGASEIDPENRLLWRAHRQRLEAEVIRDAMLLVSGQLDRSGGGPSLPVDVPGNLNPGVTGSLADNIKIPAPLKFRRTIYLPQKRKSPFDEIDFLGAFDLVDTNQESGARSVTAVPTQALYLTNSSFVQRSGQKLSERFADLTAVHRVEAVYQHALGRPPSGAEIEEAIEFIDQLSAGLWQEHEQNKQAKNREATQSEAWARFCQSILMTNEFLFRS